MVITTSQAWALQRLVPHGFEATDHDPAERHPLFFTYDNDNPDDTVSRIATCLTRNGFTSTTPPHPQKPAGTPRQQRRTQKLRDALRTIDRLEDSNAALEGRVHDLQAEKTALAEQLAQVKADVDALVDELDDATCPHPIVHSDPALQLRHEIWLTWLANTPEADRKAQPLCDYDLGPDFLESMNLQLVSRGRILVVVVDVLTRRVHQISSRRSHPLRSADAGNAPQRTRANGATAWRCDLKTGRPGGPRLAWWQHPDGRIELGKAGHHDDYHLR